MKTFAIIILTILAILGGGCSLAFTPIMFPAGFGGGDGFLTLIWLSGFAIAAACIWGIVKIRRSAKKPDQT